MYDDSSGNLREQLPVPSYSTIKWRSNQKTKQKWNRRRSSRDDLYVLFTSGTTSGQPKAVVGSHQATLRRLIWFRDTFVPSPRVARRTKLTFVDGITELWSALLDPSSTLFAISPQRLLQEGIQALLDNDELQCTQVLLIPSQ